MGDGLPKVTHGLEDGIVELNRSWDQESRMDGLGHGGRRRGRELSGLSLW